MQSGNRDFHSSLTQTTGKENVTFERRKDKNTTAYQIGIVIHIRITAIR